jgi:hypothetical protein
MGDYRIDYRIGATTATLVRLIHRGIPNPDRFAFVPYSSVNVRGDGRSIGDGNPAVTWTWETLSQLQLNALLNFFASDADASATVGIRTPEERGNRIDVGDYSAVMHRPTSGEGKTIVQDSSHPVWEEVSIRFTKLEP